jgi:polyhydroxybutyrate depolymerase
MKLRLWAVAGLALPLAGSCGKAASDVLDGGSNGHAAADGGLDSTTSGDDAGSGSGAQGDSGSGDPGAPDPGAPDAGAGEAGPPAVVCPPTSLAPGDYTRTLSVDGGTRTYYVHVPPGAPKPAALVFAFHGGGMTALGDGGLAFENFAHVIPKSDASGFVLVEPEGTPALGALSHPGALDVFNAGNCCEAAEQKNGNVDDVGFVAAMIDAVAMETCIDPKRVFATGLSNGGMLSHRLACQLSDKIAAIAAVSGGMGNRDLDTQPPTTLFPCSPTRRVPVLHIHGTQDACYPYDGGWGPLSLLTFEAVPVTIQGWLTRNGCGSGAPTTVSTHGAASCFLYPCPKTAEVELCTIDGGGHYWPGGDDWSGSTVFCGANQGVRSSDLIANDAMWAWFQAHPMP